MNGKRAKIIRKLSRVVMTDAVITSKYEEMMEKNPDDTKKRTLDIVGTRRKFYKAMKKQYKLNFAKG